MTGDLAIDLETLGLAIRTVRSSHSHAFIPGQSKPSKIPLELLLETLLGTLHIGVFNPQDKNTARLAGEQPVEKSGSSASDMQVSGWAGSKSYSHIHNLDRIMRNAG